MELVGVLAVTASLSIIVIGLPQQIYRNYRQKSCTGLAPFLAYSAFCTYTLWGLYGWLKPDRFLLTAQVPGAILSFILVLQIFYYGRKYHGRKKARG